jgi:hypothetical protein
MALWKRTLIAEDEISGHYLQVHCLCPYLQAKEEKEYGGFCSHGDLDCIFQDTIFEQICTVKNTIIRISP